VRGQVRTRRDVTAEFDAVALPEALSRILGDQAFALVYGSEGRLKAVRLLAAMASRCRLLPSFSVAAAVPGSLPGLIDRHAAIPVTGAVAERSSPTSRPSASCSI
jgi:hypothetical protein